MVKQKSKSKETKRSFKSPFHDTWVRENYVILSAGFLIIILGYFLMSIGPWDNPVSITYAPIVLLIAYLVVIPLAIFYRKKKQNEEQQ